MASQTYFDLFPEELIEYITKFMLPREAGRFSTASKKTQRITQRHLDSLLKENIHFLHPWIYFAFENLENFRKFQTISIRTITYGKVPNDKKIYQVLSLIASAFLFVIFTSRRDEDIREDEPQEILEIPRFGNYILLNPNFGIYTLVNFGFDAIVEKVRDYFNEIDSAPTGLSDTDMFNLIELIEEGHDRRMTIEFFIGDLTKTYLNEAENNVRKTLIDLFNPIDFVEKSNIANLYLFSKGLVTSNLIKNLPYETLRQFKSWFKVKSSDEVIQKEHDILDELNRVLGNSPYIISGKIFKINFLSLLR
jgi:hypothetical protein